MEEVAEVGGTVEVDGEAYSLRDKGSHFRLWNFGSHVRRKRVSQPGNVAS